MTSYGNYIPPRRLVIVAADLLTVLTHSSLDQFLLEIGLDGVVAERGSNSMQSRVTALASFAVKNPNNLTADGDYLGFAIVQKAAEKFPEGYDPGNHFQSRYDEFYRVLEAGDRYVNGGRVLPKMSPSGPPDYDHPNYVGPPPPAKEDKVTVQRLDHRIGRPGIADEDEPKFASSAKPKVFIVHGRDHGALSTVARFVEGLDLEAIILHERPNGGRTLITKFQEEAADAAFAIILMTPDDVGGALSGPTSPRARQNVVFELGFFIGRMKANRVCALVQSPLERPSDFDGVVYIEYGPATSWKTDIARELREAGVKFNPNKVF